MFDDSPYWTQQRRELAYWLDDHAPSFTHAYLGAVRLLYTPAFPARVHLVCHVVRDIYRHLPTALGAKALPRASEVYPSLVSELAKQWRKSPSRSTQGAGSTQLGIPVSPQVYRCVVKLVDRYREMAEQPRVGKQLAVALFRSGDRDANEFIPQWVIDAFDSEYDFFVSRAHLARKIDRVPTDEGLVEHFQAFERAFHSLVGPYFTGKEELDAILQDTNATAD